MPEQPQGNFIVALMEAPTRVSKFIDACTCGRADKAAVVAIKKELEAKDVAIERLEEEIRRKDTEKDNLIHMQKDLQSQIEEIRMLLDGHAAEVDTGSDEKAALLMQTHAPGNASPKSVQETHEAKEELSSDDKHIAKLQAVTRGKQDRKAVEQRAAAKELPGQQREANKAAQFVQARVRGKSSRRLVAQRAAKGVLPGQQRAGGGPPPMPMGGGPSKFTPPGAAAATGEEEEGNYPEGSSFFDENESVDSDYDYDDSAFANLGLELLAGRLKLAKVYGQEEPPAAEDELEWEVRYFVLYDAGRICHYDDMVDGLPTGDRGLINLATIHSVEKVLGVPTFVMKGENKVYLFKLVPHDEVMMRTWIAAISQELAPAPPKQ